jgi:hypothetical protein
MAVLGGLGDDAVIAVFLLAAREHLGPVGFAQAPCAGVGVPAVHVFAGLAVAGFGDLEARGRIGLIGVFDAPGRHRHGIGAQRVQAVRFLGTILYSLVK